MKSRWRSSWEESPVSPAQQAGQAQKPVGIRWRRENAAVFGNGSPAVWLLTLLASDWAIAARITGRKLEIPVEGGRDTDARKSRTD